ncbi:uncharacterized protein LOC109829580 [Asparagus officinalis]|uniref:uncharacterized protein LOC109829580 n=1 Tax=Asparagus officinalis TaxID=4686 RepID=UPI00098E6625|nr:uncharacterized protein LOC109829580 [Asparagus officinalis]
MVRKKRNNGKKILSIGLRAVNPSLATLGDHFDTDFVEDDEESPSSIMGSTGPKGERKKKTMADILETTTSLGSQMMGAFGKSPISSRSNRVSWADEVDLGKESASIPLISASKEVRSSPLTSVSNPVCPLLSASNLDSSAKLDTVSLISASKEPDSDTVNLDQATKLNTDNLNPDSSTSGGNVKKSWVSLFSDNRKPGCGLDLSYIPSGTTDTVIFDDDEWNAGASIWKFSLVGQVLGINVRFKAMESFVKKVWSHLANPEICLLKPGVFLFNFNSKDEMNEILMSGPWFFGSRPFLLKAWSMGDDFEKVDEHIYPMWIQFPALKLNLWNEKGISKIASLIGHPIATDKLTANRKRLAYARVLVQVTLPSSLPDQVVIKGPNGCSYTQRVIYELKPRWCDHCKKVGHDNQHCKRKPMVQRWIPKHAQHGISGKQEVQIDQTVQEQNAKSVIDVEITPTENRKGKEVLQEITQTTGKDFGNCQEGVKSTISGEHCSVHVVHAGQNTSRKSTQNEASRIQIQNQERKNSMIKNPFSLLNSEINDFDPFTIDRGETKIRNTKVPEAAKRIAKNWSWLSNATCSAKARILILWDPDVLDIQVLSSSPQQITCSVNSKDGNFSSILSAVYGLNHQETRRNLWLELTQIKQAIGNEAWLLCGDFNVMISCFYTWNNKQDSDSRVWCRLDRALVNDLWINKYNASHVEYMLPSFSDHSPAVISVYEDKIQGKKPFKFFKMWTKHADFIPTVSAVWGDSVRGCNMFSVYSKLKKLKESLKGLNKRHFSNISEQVLRAKAEVDEVQMKLQSDPLNSELIRQEKCCISKYSKLFACELSFYQQKARINWSLQGDKNTSFFHSIIKSNRHHSRVLTLYNSDGGKISDGEDIVNEFISFYKSLMGTAKHTSTANANIISSGPCLMENQRRDLSMPVNDEEIKAAVFSIPDNKAPGPDGYSASFYKAAWPVIGDEVIAAIREFFRTGKLLGAVNSTYIALIPKVQCPKTPADFRPISCCNCLYKFISKILANRIQTVMGFLINEAQCAFVKGRQITSNILLAHELVKNYGRKNLSPRVMINIDIRKAFDTISWDFLHVMLRGLGFPDIFTNWIMSCITSPKYSISLNGSLHGYFNGERGLRQGDPLSPYLFIIGLEYLSRSFELLRYDKQFKYHPKCRKFKISHLVFADDLLLFCKGDLYSVQKIYKCVKDFGDISGLEANPLKCSIFYGGVQESDKNAISRCLGFPEGTLPIKYLGMPLICKRMSYQDCNPLFMKITNQFQTWMKSKNLSYAGRLQIIKSVILGVQIFWTSSYILPAKALHKIDELCRNFLWGKVPLVAWSSVSTGKINGGLGVFSAALWNKATAMRTLWYIHINKESLWIKWVHGTYLKGNDIWHVKSKAGDSWLWKQLIKYRDYAVNLLGGVENLKNLISSCYVNSKVQLSALYNVLKPGSKVDWHDTVWDKLNYPKHSFIMWLAIQDKLLTQDRLHKRGIIQSNQCLLCEGAVAESRNHLFFDCNFSNCVWNGIMEWLKFKWRSADWYLLMNWYTSRLRGKGSKQRIKRLALTATIYNIWRERNARIFKEEFRSVEQLIKAIKVDTWTILLNCSLPDEAYNWLL